MPGNSSTKTSILLSVMLCGMVLLTLVSGSLYLQNRYYRQENRQLIIQNDSIMSVNIELKSALDGNPNKNLQKASFGIKKEKHQ